MRKTSKRNMKKLFSVKLNERAEALPVAIITAIVSSIILLGLASTMGVIIEQQAKSEKSFVVNNTVTNIDTSMKTDINNSTTIIPKDATSLTLHAPVASGAECKVIEWSMVENKLTRNITIYSGTLGTDVRKCNTASSVVATGKKVISNKFETDGFKYSNSLGRGMLVNNSVPTFIDSTACAFNKPKVSGVCPVVAPAVTAAWNNMSVARISLTYVVEGKVRTVEQASSVIIQ